MREFLGHHEEIGQYKNRQCGNADVFLGQVKSLHRAGGGEKCGRKQGQQDGGQQGADKKSFHNIGLTIDQSEINEDIADQDLRSRRQAIIRDVKEAYYIILKTQNELLSTRASIAFYRELDQLQAAT